MESIEYHIPDPEHVLIIRAVDNGFTLTSFPQYDGSDQRRFAQDVVWLSREWDEGDFKYQNALMVFLYKILHHFGEWGSDHHKYRLSIEVVNQSEE